MVRRMSWGLHTHICCRGGSRDILGGGTPRYRSTLQCEPLFLEFVIALLESIDVCDCSIREY